MFFQSESHWVILLVLFKVSVLYAQELNNKRPGLGSANNRFFDPRGRGMSSPSGREPGRFGNPQSNYPGNPYLPYGNQNNNIQQPQQGNVWNPIQNNYPQQSYQNYPQNNGPFQGRPNNFDNGVNPGFNNMNQNPNYQRPSYSNTPGDRVVSPGNINQNGGPFNQGGYPNQAVGMPDDLMLGRYPQQNGLYPSQNGQYPTQGNLPAGRPNYQPNYPGGLNNNLDTRIQFPGNAMLYPNQPNQYPPQNNQYPSQNNRYPSQNNPFQLNNPVNNVQYLPNNLGINDGSIQFPNQGHVSSGPNQLVSSNGNGTPQMSQPSGNIQQIGATNGQNGNGTGDILGQPVFAPATASPNISKETPTQKQCEQNCSTTSEYNPVCGTNSVTYFNPAKLYCARNCGIAVSFRQMGTCTRDRATVSTQQ